MKDYITKVSNLSLFMQNLTDDFNSSTPSGNSIVNENGEPKLNCIKTGLIANDGLRSVAICRITLDQLDWFLSLGEHCVLLGEAAESVIKSEMDIKWKKDGRSSYHEIHKQDQVYIGDGDLYTPPVLHCVLG
tara:strand:- start:113 stop:508 length:396 start_codon:yes stop_codon:yes gene_type:complete